MFVRTIAGVNDRSVAHARQMMRRHHIRHLPVVDGQQVVGVISERDLAVVESLPGANPTDVRVEEAMNRDVYAVSPDDALDAVSREMAERKLGSAVVIERGEVFDTRMSDSKCELRPSA